MKKKIPTNILTASILSLIVIILVIVLATEFAVLKEVEPIYPGPGVTEIKMLSDWFPKLKGTNGDTEVYILDSKTPGASMLVLGGTHPNEPSGFISAVALIESCRPTVGKLFVIPRANNSAFTCTDPQEAAPMRFYLEGAHGQRFFRFGSRATNPTDQWPDSEVYVHASSGQRLSGSETRNLNRAYPGKENGNFTERVAYGITQLITKENISITVDLHEASPEYTTVNAIVSHENALDLASLSLWNVEEIFDITVELSPKNLHGLTHRELGDYTNTLALLMETANPSQGRLHGKMDSDLIVSGDDKFYHRAYKADALTVKYPDYGISLTERCARHLTCLYEFCFNYEGPDGLIDLGSFPSYKQIMTNGIGSLLY